MLVDVNALTFRILPHLSMFLNSWLLKFSNWLGIPERIFDYKGIILDLRTTVTDDKFPKLPNKKTISQFCARLGQQEAEVVLFGGNVFTSVETLEVIVELVKTKCTLVHRITTGKYLFYFFRALEPFRLLIG